jgi:hypothetical protein
MEVLAAFPGVAGLRRFRDWVYSADVPDARAPPPEPELPAGASDADRRAARAAYLEAAFKYEHRRSRSRWDVSRSFPDGAVVDAYLRPPVDRSSGGFSWAAPDEAAVVEMLERKLAWHHSQTRRLLAPVLARGGDTNQTRLLTLYGPAGRFASVESKRVRRALQRMAQDGVRGVSARLASGLMELEGEGELQEEVEEGEEERERKRQRVEEVEDDDVSMIDDDVKVDDSKE